MFPDWRCSLTDSEQWMLVFDRYIQIKSNWIICFYRSFRADFYKLKSVIFCCMTDINTDLFLPLRQIEHL